jgi:hypothetical protein
MSDLTEFEQYYLLAHELIDELSKDKLAECARMLALQLGDYARRLGDIPYPDLLLLLGVGEIMTSTRRC